MVRDDNGRRTRALGYSAEVLGFSQSAFTLLRDLIARQAGVFYGDDKQDLLADKLSGLVASLGMTSFLDYYYLLRYDAEAERHWAALMDHLAVPETYFWRQSDQIVALARTIAPAHFARRGDAPLRIWSAACCSGEEPLSIAMALDEAGLLGRRPIEIVASDASAAMLERARRGVYFERSFRALPPALAKRWFRPEAGGGSRVDPWLHQQVRWTTANLVDPGAVRTLADVDVIFCRNVFIYFADDTITDVVRSMAGGLHEDGYLFLGASESLTRLQTEFALTEVDGAFAYVKGSGARASHGPRADGGAYVNT